MRGLILALLASFFLHSDSGRSVWQLMSNASQARSPQSLLWRAATQGNEQAQQQLVERSVAAGQPFWLDKLVSLDNADAAWALYQMKEENVAPELMKLAAVGAVPEAQLEYAMSTEDAQKRETWLLRAARQSHPPAQAALADWYLLNQEFEKAKPWLRETAATYPQSAYQLGRLLWEEGDIEAGRAYLAQGAAQGNAAAKKLINLLKTYHPSTIGNISEYSFSGGKQCLQRIQMFARSLSSMERADALYQTYKQDDRLNGLSLCLLPPVWLVSDELQCSSNWGDSHRLGCDIRPLAPVVEKRDLTHAVIVSERGKANINNGVMFLDITDTYDVFVHELAHFAGFVDEYPLNGETAERYCDGRSIPNIIFDGRLTYAPLSTLERWREIQHDVGIWPVKTCDNVSRQAFKASDQITFLEHHDSGVIPALYLELWEQQLQDPLAAKPIYLNLFQAFHRHGQTPQAGVWLEKYESMRETPQN